MAKRKGTDGDDTLNGGGRDDVLLGLAGNDMLSGNNGDDVLKPGTGADTLSGGGGDDVAVFADLNSAEPDTFDGGKGLDTLDLSKVGRGVFAYDTYWNVDSETGLYSVDQYGSEPDRPLTFTNVETLIATEGADLMILDSADDLNIDAGGGSDFLILGYGDNVVHCGAGNDRIDLGIGRVEYYGEAGNDQIAVRSATGGSANGGRGVDTIESYDSVNLAAGWALTYSGDRVEISNFENITLVGAAEGAVARGDDKNNVLDCFLGPGNYVFFGAGGDDQITGSSGSDRLSGDDGDDVLEGKDGVDRLIGGRGADIFRFTQDFFSQAAQTDTIADFSRKDRDRIDLSGFDVNASTPERDGFQFIGGAAFTGRAGELRSQVIGGKTYVQGDTDGDGSADLTIRLARAIVLERGDFLLEPSDGSPIQMAERASHFDYPVPAPVYVDTVLP